MNEREKQKEIERMQIISDVTNTLTAMTHTPSKQNLNFSAFTNKNNFYTDQSGYRLKQIKAFKDRIKSETESKDDISTILRSHQIGSNSISRSTSLLRQRNNSISSLLPNISNAKTNRNVIESILKSKNDFPFCPHCPHCNEKYENKVLRDYIFELKEAKNIISKGCEYIINNSCLEKLDKIFKCTDPESLLLSEEDEIEFKRLKEKQIINFDEFLLEYKNNTNSTQSRNVYQIVSSFMNVLIEGDVEIEKIVPESMLIKLKDKLIAKGQLFDKMTDKISFDPEIESLFDGKTKEIISNLFRKKYLISLNELKKENEKLYANSSKRYLVLFLIFIQILAELYSDCKEKATLLYKFFVNFFAEQDKKWIYVVSKMKERVKFYKNLAKTILQQKHKNIEHIEDLNNVFFANKVTKENLQYHKNVISELLRLVNEKREMIYQLEAKISILEHELNFWVYDFENIKLDKRVREKRESMNVDDMIYNINEEMKHKNLSSVAKSLILNSDMYLILSGQRGYFYEQKKFYLSENRRLANVVNQKQMRKKYYKELLQEHKILYQREKDKHEEDVNFLRDRLACVKEEREAQTDVDIYKFNKLLKNNDLILIHKRLTQNKLTDMVEKVNYGCSKVKPLTKQSLMNLIPDLYVQKFNNDNEKEKQNLPKLNFDEFFLQFMTEKFKLQKLIRKHSEETISAILYYEKTDIRISLFKRFLGIDPKDKIYREVLDVYLILLQNLPMSFAKLFYDKNYLSYLMDTNYCFEILHNRLGFYNILLSLKDLIILNSNIYDPNTKEIIHLSNDKKREYYYLNRFAEKSIVFFNDLIIDSKNNVKQKDITTILQNIQDANAIFNLQRDTCIDILSKNFKVDLKSNTIELDSFLEFFVNKMVFRMQVFEFCEITFSGILIIFQSIEKKINKILIEIDIQNGLIYYKDFELILMKLINNNELRWKLPSYFSEACGTETRDFIAKEELVSFVMNSRDLLSILFMSNAAEILPNEKDKKSNEKDKKSSIHEENSPKNE